ncbi:lipid phosphate phosphatase 2 isoform X2 [Manihot esculenta]|uniref:lipid phosphate phosphatase 2 isoform X2 n=1 Tax=Manihot esculenta TaxID=3983 RepID=UPI000B5D1079|nr:lipid phosphate phosphatase 2 isoform X2 [Manihot esculenta]
MPWRDFRSLSCFKNFMGIFKDASTKRLEITANTCQSFSTLDLALIEHKDKENKMREVQLGSHTVMSHGVTVARTHMHDWLILLVLVVIEVILYVIHPFYRFVGKDMMSDLKYPFKSNTVPVWAVPIYAVILPMVIFLIIYFRRRDIYDLHHAILGNNIFHFLVLYLLKFPSCYQLRLSLPNAQDVFMSAGLFYSVLVTAVITDSIKNAVGRPRPDFFWRCFPDGKDVYDQLGNVICHGDKNIIKEGHKSFPSGHTSWSFAGLSFLSLYLSGKIKAFDRRGHVAKLCIVFLPLLVACLVGISRVDDYWHHWQDVFAGGLLGLVVATFCYLQFFPPPYHPQGHVQLVHWEPIKIWLGTLCILSGIGGVTHTSIQCYKSGKFRDNGG